MLGIDLIEFKEKLWEQMGIPKDAMIAFGMVCIGDPETGELTQIALSREQIDAINAYKTIEKLINSRKS